MDTKEQCPTLPCWCSGPHIHHSPTLAVPIQPISYDINTDRFYEWPEIPPDGR